MMTFRALGALITYPTGELIAALPEIAAVVIPQSSWSGLSRPSTGMSADPMRNQLSRCHNNTGSLRDGGMDGRLGPGNDERGMRGVVEDPLAALLYHLASTDLLTLQEDYVALFDRTRSLSLHLYEHVWGDARERGQAMVRLQTLYRLHGFAHTPSELPDYLPLFCEFLSLVPEKAARTILSDAAPIVETLRQRLEERGSPYAAVMAALVSLASKDLNPVLLGQIAKGTLPDDDSFEALDRAWEEAPVEFAGAAAPASPCSPARAEKPAA